MEASISVFPRQHGLERLSHKNPPIQDHLEFQLVTTDHLSEGVWFKDDRDFKIAMNLVAIVSFVTGASVLAFVLMSNHVHFVLQCGHDTARKFITEFKRRFSQHLATRYGSKEFLRKNGVDIRPVRIDDESLEKAIAYVLMNPVAANICLYSGDYPWGSGSIYFRSVETKGIRIGALSRRRQTLLLSSKEVLPSEMLIGEDGYILPESYIPVTFVESLFRTPKRMFFFLMNSSKAKRRLTESESGMPSFKDQLILAAIPDMCASLFRKSSLVALSKEEMAELSKQIRMRFSADVNQISRVMNLSYSEVVSLLESF